MTTQYYRKRNTILYDNQQTIVESFEHINAAKRKSRKLQQAGHTVTRLANKAGVK